MLPLSAGSLLHGVVLHLLDLEVPEGAVARDGAEHHDGQGAAHGDGGRLVAEGLAAGGAHELCGQGGGGGEGVRANGQPGGAARHSPGPNSPFRKMNGCTRTSRSSSCTEMSW